MVEIFSYRLNQTVKISVNGQVGTVVGRAEYLDAVPIYFVRYCDRQGEAKQEWWSHSAIEPMPPNPTDTLLL